MIGFEQHILKLAVTKGSRNHVCYIAYNMHWCRVGPTIERYLLCHRHQPLLVLIAFMGSTGKNGTAKN